MDKQIAVLSTGAIGSSIGADLSHAGYNVCLVDQWPAHVEAILVHDAARPLITSAMVEAGPPITSGDPTPTSWKMAVAAMGARRRASPPADAITPRIPPWSAAGARCDTIALMVGNVRPDPRASSTRIGNSAHSWVLRPISKIGRAHV